MRIYQRVGRNTGIGFPAWAPLFGLLLVIGLVTMLASALGPMVFALATFPVFAALYWLADARIHIRAHKSTVAQGCKFCQRETRILREREQAEIARAESNRRLLADQAEAQRLRTKYRT